MNPLIDLAAKHADDIVRLAIGLPANRKALVVFDVRSPLARIVTEAYRRALPSAVFIDFDAVPQQAVLDAVDTLVPGDLAVLIQSTNFLLDAYRFRIELFKRSLSVVEHVHLERADDERQLAIYVDAMAYDPDYYRPLGRRIKARLDAAERVVARCAGTELVYEGGMEEAKLNVGDYSGMKNVGGTFPIGEVFCEPKDLERVNGEAMVFAFAGMDHLVQIHEPFRIRIERGTLVSHEGPPAFQEVIEQITASERPLVREFGVSINRAMGKDRLLKDITAFERQRGLHFSLGEKHGVYKKPGLSPKKTHYHIDIFIDVQAIDIDGVPLEY